VPDVSTETEQHPEPVVVGGYATSGEAEVAQALLRSVGIDSSINDQVEGGILPVEGDGSVFLEVRAGDADQARLILGATVDEERLPD